MVIVLLTVIPARARIRMVSKTPPQTAITAAEPSPMQMDMWLRLAFPILRSSHFQEQYLPRKGRTGLKFTMGFIPRFIRPADDQARPTIPLMQSGFLVSYAMQL